MTYTEQVSFPVRHLLLLTALTASVAAQSAPPTPAAVTPADAATGIPPVAGTPKPLYTLRYIDTLLGTGPLAEPQKFYTVRYTGWLPDGTRFDSSDDHPGKQPITFPYGSRSVILGWDTGFEGMHVGGKRRLYIPYQLAYGDAGRPPIPPRSDLIFDVELVAMSDTPPADPDAAPTAPPPTGAASSSTTTPPPTKPDTAPQP